MTTSVPAVVLPVFERYLSALGAHPDELTTLIFGWQGKNQEPARRLIGPERLCRKYGHIPFLFRATETTGKVTHAAIAGLIVHRDQPEYKQQEQFLYESRVERFTGAKRSDEVGPHEIGSFYVVAAGMELPEPIAFEALTLLSQGRPLNPKMARGYAIVGLPSQLIGWHDEAVRTWDRLAAAKSL